MSLTQTQLLSLSLDEMTDTTRSPIPRQNPQLNIFQAQASRC